MTQYVFRKFKISRTCSKNFVDYTSYRSYLKEDFHHRCAYCNLLDTAITTPFEIDHYIPEKIFKDVRPELKYEYANLMYSCKKCNGAKLHQYDGDGTCSSIVNELFYDPSTVDLNNYFYRNEYGTISSDDPKGLKMINLLHLHRSIHNMAWICEEIDQTLDRINSKLKNPSNVTPELIKSKQILSDYSLLCKQVFISNYNNSNFSL
ncbi:hypothetical protein MmiHf6_10330 [Methanimicrococcus hongohii]|uniref:HNH nuclease domain-containing protein n=1 Tax=Methanimicrococcus hongohii TaxID=3028295 RepID=A0AA96ZSQ5_9EURY|nr:HNH endonuclease [Methanimicrococcus sp. Hf6]WNY23719.1 hypothetical protein MmiHf6_10330 [Methanimicrococcus sp. Hf6]